MIFCAKQRNFEGAEASPKQPYPGSMQPGIYALGLALAEDTQDNPI